MNFRSQPRRNWIITTVLAMVAVLAMVVAPAPQPMRAAAGYPPDVMPSTQNEGLWFTSQPDGIIGEMSIGTGIVIPTVSNTTGGLDGWWIQAPTIVSYDNCIVFDVQHSRFEGEAQRDSVQFWDTCNTPSPLLGADYDISSLITSGYVYNTTYSTFHSGWTGQGTYTDDVIKFKIDDDPGAGTNCSSVWFWHPTNMTWDNQDTECGTQASLFARTEFIHGAASGTIPTTDLGSAKAIGLHNIQIRDARETGVGFRNMTAADVYFYPGGTSVTGFSNLTYMFEWARNTGAAENQWVVCGLTANNDDCTYSHFDLGPYNFQIQRNSPDNSIVRGANQKLKLNRSYNFHENAWAGASKLWVDIGRSATTDWAISSNGRGATLKSGSTAPTCTLTGTKYECIAAAGTTLDNIHFRAETLTNGTGLSMQSGATLASGSIVTDTRTYYVAP